MPLIVAYRGPGAPPVLQSVLLLLLAAALAPRAARADPLACQPNEAQPMLPIFHIIGNVSALEGGNLSVEAINDASGVTYSNGIYHLWHQCCQNHWDHVISRDLAHWQRLPPPIQPVTLRTFDGSISMVDAAFGGPVILYDAPDGKDGGGPLRDAAILGVARLVDPANDKYLQLWVRSENNPVNFSGAPIAFPGQVWRNGDHFNFVGQGSRFQTSDPTFHSWTNMGAFTGVGEHSGDWTVPVPNQVGGAPPPPGSPNLAVNVFGGADYLLGTYDPAAETFAPWRPANETPGRVVRLEGGRADWFGGGGGTDNNGRMMIVGWALPDFKGPAGPGVDDVTRLTLVREVNYDAALGLLVANPLPEISLLRAESLASERGVALGNAAAPHLVPGTAGGAAASADLIANFSGFAQGAVLGLCVLVNGSLGGGLGVAITISAGESRAWLPNTNLPGCEYENTKLNSSDAHLCQALCAAEGDRCVAWTSAPQKHNTSACSLKSCVPTPPQSNAKDISGIKANAPPGSVLVRVGSCADVMQGGGNAAAPALAPFRMLAEDNSTLTLRVFSDRSVADIFLQAGRWAGTISWLDAEPRAADASTVALWSSQPGVTADIDVWRMGCGWVDPSWTDAPSL
jgi:hypothetical protein